MRIGLNLVGVSPRRIPELAQHAELLGYESVFLPDHVVVPVEFTSKYPGTEDGSFPYPRPTRLYDPFVVLAMVAQATTRIRLGTAIFLLGLRHPLIAARTLTTLDVLSGGRVIFGVGVGWLTEEFDALGIDPHTRSSRLEEAATAIRRLWEEAEPSFEGHHVRFPPVDFEPKPRTSPHPPILFGGDSMPALRRAVAFGDGWISGGTSGVEDVAARVQQINKMRDEVAAPTDNPFDITVLFPDPSPAEVESLESIGVHRVVVMPGANGRNPSDVIERFRATADAVRGIEWVQPN